MASSAPCPGASFREILLATHPLGQNPGIAPPSKKRKVNTTQKVVNETLARTV